MIGLISLAIIIGVIWIEVVTFGIVGSAIGALLTIIGVFVTAVIGMRLFRVAGASTLKRMAGAVSQGKAPITEIADGAAIIMAAGLLLIPGYATDALGLILFIPGIRTVLMVALLTLITRMAPGMGKRGFQFSSHHVNMGMGRDENPFGEDKSSTMNAHTINDGDDASNATIEGDYKQHE